MRKLLVFVSFFALCINLQGQSPGGIGKTKMSLWYSGDFGVSDTGTLEWEDRSDDTNNAQQPTASEKAIQSNYFNFNSTFTFDGTSDRFAISGLNYANGQILSELSAFVVYATDFSNNSYSSNWSFLDFDRSESFNFYIHGNGRLAMSFQSEGTQDLVATTVTNNGLPHIASYLFDGDESNESVMRLDGFEDYVNNNTSSNITVSANRYGFIGDGSEASSFNGSKNNIYYDGDIAEIIFYDKGDLDATDIKKIESYLAMKYGITLDVGTTNYVNSSNTSVWDNSIVGYWNGVAGIIQDDTGALHQKISKSNDYEALIVSTDNDYVSANIDESRSDVGEGKSLFFGHNNQPDGFSAFGGSGSEYLFNKTWLFKEKNGDVGDVFIAIDKSIFTGESVDLIVSANDSFDGSDTRYAMTEGPSHYYVEVNIANNSYVSFVMTQTTKAPGGVVGGLEIWFKSDVGVTSSGSSVSNVTDQTFNGYDLSQSASTNQPTNSSMTNFNSNITFDGSNDRMPIKDKNFTSSDNLNQVYVWTVFNTDFSNTGTSGSVNTANWAFLDFDRSEWFNTSIHGDGTLQFAYNSGGIKDNFGVETANDGTANLGGFIFDTNVTEETKIRVNGNEDYSADVTSAPINSSLTRYGYVGDGSEASTFNSAANNAYYDGSISEVIYYENQTISPEDINKIESYLAVKYGITLNTSSLKYSASDAGVTIWDDMTYWNDIGVIGLDENSSLNQKQSRSTNADAILTVALGNEIKTSNIANTNSFDDDLDFFAWGNNDTDAVISELVFPTLITGISNCEYDYIGFDRDWKVKNTGNVTGVTLQFDLTGFSNPGEFDLLIDEDGNANYSDGAHRLLETGVLTGSNLVFSNIDIADGEVFTLIRKNPDAQIVYESDSWSGGNSAGVLDNSATDLLKSVQIKQSVVLPTEANCKCMEVVSGAVVTVENGKDLTVSDVLELEGEIYLYGDAQLIQTLDDDDFNKGGGAIYKMVSEGTSSIHRFNYWGSPVRDTNTYNLATNLFIANDANDFTSLTIPNFTTGIDGSLNTISSYWLYHFNNAQAWSYMDEFTQKLKGSGFTMKGTGSSTNYVFVGKPNNGTIKLDLDQNNYYLLGNPYPSVINADDFNSYHFDNDITDGYIYLWDQPSGDSHYKADYEGGYATRAGGLSSPAASIVVNGEEIDFTKEPNEFIAVGQGFMVAGTSDNSEIRFKNSFRDIGSAVFFKSNGKKKKTATDDLQIVRIGFEYDTPKGVFHRQLVTSPRGLSMEVDRGYDAPMFDHYASDMYWDLANDLRYVISGIPYLEEELEVPLAIVLGDDTEVTIKLDATKNYPHHVYLLDKENGDLTDLEMSSTTIPLQQGTHKDRFAIVLKVANSLSIDAAISNNLSVYYNKEKEGLIIKGTDIVISNFSLYSLTGLTLIQENFNNETIEKTIEVNDLTSGVYIAKIQTSKGVFSKKVLISR
ncbi:T9SS type A sorting domain-containing protein [Flavicella marina]|uniref:T9SS type A sorting domain-containing protein n=1 Tax=Flavicella marina TaxID=1475951 RepID=UPI001264A151|nr:T9SS type A sorting domain-containing protein [Flavicella marina]